MERQRESVGVAWLDQPNNISIPVGSVFQADIPEWTSQATHQNVDTTTESEKEWLGTRIWPLHETNQQQHYMEEINAVSGRCTCSIPGSEDCINVHVLNEKARLIQELGEAFWNMRLHETGHLISMFWSEHEKKVLESAVIISNPPSKKPKCFVEVATKHLLYQTRLSILRYYYNVYLPKKISRRIKSGLSVADSDEEEEAGESAATNKKRKRTLYLRK